MGAAGRARARSWELSSPANRAGRFVETGVYRISGQSILWADLLVESTSPACERDRRRERARPPVGTRALERHLYLQNRASRHDRQSRLRLPTTVYHSVPQAGDRAPGTGGQILRCAFSAARAWIVGDVAGVPREANRFPYRIIVRRIDLYAYFLNDCRESHCRSYE